MAKYSHLTLTHDRSENPSDRCQRVCLIGIGIRRRMGMTQRWYLIKWNENDLASQFYLILAGGHLGYSVQLTLARQLYKSYNTTSPLGSLVLTAEI